MKIAGLILMIFLGVLIYSLIAVLGEKRSCCSGGHKKDGDGEKKLPG